MGSREWTEGAFKKGNNRAARDINCTVNGEPQLPARTLGCSLSGYWQQPRLTGIRMLTILLFFRFFCFFDRHVSNLSVFSTGSLPTAGTRTGEWTDSSRLQRESTKARSSRWCGREVSGLSQRTRTHARTADRIGRSAAAIPDSLTVFKCAHTLPYFFDCDVCLSACSFSSAPVE